MTEQNKNQIIWRNAAPLKQSKRQALADLEYFFPDPEKRAKYRVVKKGSQWATQYGVGK